MVEKIKTLLDDPQIAANLSRGARVGGTSVLGFGKTALGRSIQRGR